MLEQVSGNSLDLTQVYAYRKKSLSDSLLMILDVTDIARKDLAKFQSSTRISRYTRVCTLILVHDTCSFVRSSMALMWLTRILKYESSSVFSRPKTQNPNLKRSGTLSSFSGSGAAREVIFSSCRRILSDTSLSLIVCCSLSFVGSFCSVVFVLVLRMNRVLLVISSNSPLRSKNIMSESSYNVQLSIVKCFSSVL